VQDPDLIIVQRVGRVIGMTPLRQDSVQRRRVRVPVRGAAEPAVVPICRGSRAWVSLLVERDRISQHAGIRFPRRGVRG
jgi:hypothetical protein